MNSDKQKWEKVYERDNLPWVENPTPTEIVEKFTSYFEEGDKILDYGGGDGLLAKLLVDKKLDVTLTDISEKALSLAKQQVPEIKIEISENPHNLKGTFKGVLVWGVMHHVQKSEWEDYLKSFHELLDSKGVALIGGHSTKDEEFKNGYRISPTTDIRSDAVDSIGQLAQKNGFKLLEEGCFPFKEAFTGSDRCFMYFFLEKQS